MLKYFNYDIVFQEIPDEISLAVNISNCPNRCEGCHSPHLQTNIGEHLNKEFIDSIIEKYNTAISCFCFMGGDNAPTEVANLAKYIRKHYPQLKTAWYSGCAELPTGFESTQFNYIKLGGYLEEFGSLKNKNSNQRMFKIGEDGEMKNITNLFQLN